ncbi:MAG: phosphotransferase [Armatimonas sp.]
MARSSLSLEQVEAFLKTQVGYPIYNLAPLGQGDWSQAFAFDCDKGALVARFGAYVEDFQKDRFATRFRVPDLPVPHIWEIGKAFGGYFCLSERAEGTHLEQSGPEELRGLVPAVCRLLEALCCTDISQTKGFGGWGEDGNASVSTWQECLLSVNQETERVHGWRAVLEEFPEKKAIFEAGLAYLETHLYLCPEERWLVHNDLLHFNVLVADGQISAVVDWGCSFYGDFLCDLAAFTFYAPWYPAMEGIDWEAEARQHFENADVSIPNFTVRLRCCEAYLALGNMAYSAFTRSPEGLKWNARRLKERLEL